MRYNPFFFWGGWEKNKMHYNASRLNFTDTVRSRIPEVFEAISREAKFVKVRGIFVRAAEVARKFKIARASLQREPRNFRAQIPILRASARLCSPPLLSRAPRAFGQVGSSAARRRLLCSSAR